VGSQVECRRRENRGAIGGEGVGSGEELCPFPENLNFSSQNGVISCIFGVLFLRFMCPMNCSCMINFIPGTARVGPKAAAIVKSRACARNGLAAAAAD